MTQISEIQLRRGTAATWTAANPVLALGEPGFEEDSGKLKIGDGVTSWNALAYSTVLPSQVGAANGAASLDNHGQVPLSQLGNAPGGSSGVASFNTRTGAVSLSKADVTGTGLAAADIGADASGAASTAQTNAQTFATNAVNAETTRAEAAEAALMPLKTAITIDGSQTALGTNYTPATLTMAIKNHQRHVDPVPSANLTNPFITHHFDPDAYDLSQLTVFARTLPTATAGSGSYDTSHEEGLGITAGSSGWTQDLPWSGGPIKAPYMVAYTRVTAHTGTDEVRVGFYKNSSNYVCAYYDGTNYGTRINGTSTAHTKTVNTPPSTPFTLACFYAWPDVMGAFIFDDGNIFLFGSSQHATDTRSTTEPANWSPYVGVTLAANDTLRVSQMRAGYIGGTGLSNPQAITYADGTPVTHGDDYYFTATIPAGVSSWQGTWSCVIALNSKTYRARLVSVLLFQVGTYLGALCPTKAVYDSANDRYILISSAWGMQGSGINTQPYYSATPTDITQPGVYFISATQMSLPTTSGYGGAYDMDLRYDTSASLWKLVGAESSASGHGPALWTSSNLTTWTLVAADHTTSATTEGVRWAKVGGAWWILGGNTGTGVEYYDASLNHQGTITTNWNNGSLPFGTNWPTPIPHPTLLAIHDDQPVAQTRYLWVTMSWTTTNIDISGASKVTVGGLLVCEATQVPTGHEWPIRRVWRAN